MHSPTLAELQTAQAIGRFEGRYGDWIAVNNWGAIQCAARATDDTPCPAGCVEHGDSNAEGVKYRGCFRVYATPVEGAAALLHQLYRREGVPEAMRAGNATATADAMRATRYFEAPAAKYAKAIADVAASIATSLGEELAVTLTGPTPPPLVVELDEAAAALVVLMGIGILLAARARRA